jgi:hypothetical protein
MAMSGSISAIYLVHSVDGLGRTLKWLGRETHVLYLELLEKVELAEYIPRAVVQPFSVRHCLDVEHVVSGVLRHLREMLEYLFVHIRHVYLNVEVEEHWSRNETNISTAKMTEHPKYIELSIFSTRATLLPGTLSLERERARMRKILSVVKNTLVRVKDT